jgi:hypothetical protein
LKLGAFGLQDVENSLVESHFSGGHHHSKDWNGSSVVVSKNVEDLQ